MHTKYCFQKSSEILYHVHSCHVYLAIVAMYRVNSSLCVVFGKTIFLVEWKLISHKMKPGQGLCNWSFTRYLVRFSGTCANTAHEAQISLKLALAWKPPHWFRLLFPVKLEIEAVTHHHIRHHDTADHM